MGRDEKDRDDSGPTVRLPADLLKNPLLLIFLSLMSGGTGVTLFVEDDKHKVVAQQLHDTEERMIKLQESFLAQCGACPQAVELNYPLQTKLFEIGQDVKSMHWDITRMHTDTELHLRNGIIHHTNGTTYDDEDN